MPAESQAQRGYLAEHFGIPWMRQHHFDNKGPLPKHLAAGGVARINPQLTHMRPSDTYKSRKGGIHINPAHKGEFTAKAKKGGMGVQAYASRVLAAPKGEYPASTRKQANFAKNASKFNH